MLLFGVLCDIACHENIRAKWEIVFRFDTLNLEFI
jgi:hypothetical protein